MDSITDSDIWMMVQALAPDIKWKMEYEWVVRYPAGETAVIVAKGSTMMEALYNFYDVLQNGPTYSEPSPDDNDEMTGDE